MNEENVQQITESTNTISHWSAELLKTLGVSDASIKYLNLIFLTVLLVILVLILQAVTRKILQLVFRKIGKLPRMSFIAYLSRRRFPHFLAMIVPFSLVKGSVPIIFEGFPKMMTFVDKLTDIYLIFYFIWLLMSVVKAFGDTLKEKDSLNDKPIDSYIQVVSIFLYFFGFIILFSILTGQNPTQLITGLGAMSAILMLVFKDTILGFVASIQVSSNDMVRIGDWITVPKHDADGNVIQISLTTVKIQNFDNTISTIPPYSLISDSFQNWRGMQDTGCRRIKRSVFIKQSSIRFILDSEIDRFREIQYIKSYIEERQQEIQEFNEEEGSDKTLLVNGRNLTNIGLFRKYVENYLKNHPRITNDFTLMVRQMPPSPKGLPLEIYAFSNTSDWVAYEGIMSDVFDHTIAAVKYFDLETFEDISNPVHTTQSSK